MLYPKPYNFEAEDPLEACGLEPNALELFRKANPQDLSIELKSRLLAMAAFLSVGNNVTALLIRGGLECITDSPIRAIKAIDDMLLKVLKDNPELADPLMTILSYETVKNIANGFTIQIDKIFMQKEGTC